MGFGWRIPGTALLGSVLVLAALPAVPATAAPEVTLTDGPVERLVVAYEPGTKAWTSTTDVAGEEFVPGVDLEAGKWIGFGFRTVELPTSVDEASADQLADQLAQAPEVLSAFPDLPMSIAVEQSESRIGPEAVQSNPPWGLDRIDQRALPLNQQYDYATTGSGVRAYIVDTGIRSTHTDFGGRVVSGYSSISDGNGTEDCDGHGTHVAGTVGGTSYGVAKDATLVPVRVLNCAGSGSTSTVVSGLNWVRNNHPAGTPGVVNMSLGGGVDPTLDFAVAQVVAAGITVVVASGNSGSDACNYSPAREPSAITVNASTSSDDDAGYSNYGSCTDIYAPGSSVKSAWYTSDTATNTISGTSMASPHVAGVAARVLESNPTFTPAQVWQAIQDDSTAVDFYPVSPDDAKGLVFIGTDAPTAPSAPTGVSAVAGNAQVAVTWQAPTYLGGTDLVSYTATVVNGDDSCTVTGSPPATTCVIAGLTNWQDYSVTVTATNAVGTSVASAASTPVQPGVIPSTPTIDSVTAGAGEATVTWTPGASVGAPSTTFIARASPGTRACASAGTSCTITGLTGGTDYTVTVLARNDFGDSAPSAPSATVTPTPAVVVLPDPGTLVRWGTPDTVPSDFYTDVVALSAGNSHLLGVTGTGTVIATGDNTYGQSTVPVAAQSGATDIAAGAYHSLALVGGGVVAWGRNDDSQIDVPVELLSGVSSIAAGRQHSLALKDGQLYGWGDAAYGQLAFPDDSVGYSAIAAGAYHSLGLKDGLVRAWGNDTYGQSTVPSAVQAEFVTAIAAGTVNNLVLTDTGKVMAWGDSATGVNNVPAALSEGVDAIAMGELFALAIKDGVVYAWGMDSGGNTVVPTAAQADIEVITGGSGFAAALRSTPVAPANLSAAPVDDSTIQISWDPIARTGTVIDYYTISYSVTSNGVTTLAADDSTSSTNYTLGNISAGDVVTVTVTGRNLTGLGQPASTTGRIPVPPGAVQGLTGSAGNALVNVSWSAPADNGGSPITRYEYRVNEGLWSSTSSTAVTITSLTNGVAAVIDVRAVNAVGVGPLSTITRTPAAPFVPPPVVAPPPVVPIPEPEPEPEPVTPIPPTPAPVTEPVAPGSGQAVVDGEPVLLDIAPLPDGGGLDIVGPDFTVLMESFGPDGEPVPVDDDGSLRLEPYLTFVTQGTGYLPNAEVAQYLVEAPGASTRQGAAATETRDDTEGYRELGSAVTDELGFFAGVVVMPGDVPGGDYMVQIVGTSPTGAQRVITVGVRVDEPEPIELPSIVINGYREGRFVRVDGFSTGIEGQKVFPMYKLPGMTSYIPGLARRTVAEDGTFSWQRRTRKKFYVYFQGETTRSTVVRIPAP